MKSFKTFRLLGFILLLAAGFMLGQTQPQSQTQPQTPASQELAFRPALLEQPFPDFSLPTYQDGSLTLSSLRGKNVVLIISRVYAGEGRYCTICDYKYAEAVEVEKKAKLREKYNAEVLFLFAFSREEVAKWLAALPAQLEKIKNGKNPPEPEKLDQQGKERMERMRKFFPLDLSLKEGEVPLPFPLLLDADRKLSKTLGVFATEWSGSKVDQGIPSVFILDKNGVLQFKYISQNTADRPSYEYLMKILNMIGR
ncbi:MAG: redoxin domain-containing protein [Candidatus Aminicenantales bacterium]